LHESVSLIVVYESNKLPLDATEKGCAPAESLLLLCSELDPARCHRTKVAKSLAQITKSTIQHLR
jgi:hypothetical protein